MKRSDLTSIHSVTPLQTLLEIFSFNKLAPSVLPYSIMCWPIESEFILSSSNIMLFLIGILQLLTRISLIDTEIKII